MRYQHESVLLVISKHCPLDCLAAGLNAIRECGLVPNGYFGIPPPEPPLTNSAASEALRDLETATIIVTVSTELPVTPEWLTAHVARAIEKGAHVFEYLFSPGSAVDRNKLAFETEVATVGEFERLLATSVRAVVDHPIA